MALELIYKADGTPIWESLTSIGVCDTCLETNAHCNCDEVAENHWHIEDRYTCPCGAEATRLVKIKAVMVYHPIEYPEETVIVGKKL